MDIKLKEFIVGFDKSYKITDIKYCCDEIKNCECIELAKQWGKDEPPTICISEATGTYDGEIDYEYIPIKHCPFCGTKLFCSVLESEDLGEYYNAVRIQELDIRAAARKEDSKEKERELLKQARDLSDELNFYLKTDKIHSDRV